MVSTNTKCYKGKPRICRYIHISSEKSLTHSQSHTIKPTMVTSAAIHSITTIIHSTSL